MSVEILPCAACGAQISCLSEKCLGCGHPNNWTNPKIERFLEIKDEIQTKTRFTYVHDKSILKCQATGSYPVWFWICLALLVLCFTASVIAGFIAGFALTLVAGFCREKKSLTLDFTKENPVIENTDREFWKPVLLSLNIPD